MKKNILQILILLSGNILQTTKYLHSKYKTQTYIPDTKVIHSNNVVLKQM